MYYGDFDEFLVGVFTALIIVGLFSIMIFTGPNRDAVDIKAFGEKACAEYNLGFAGREYTDPNHPALPTILCKNQTNTPILDGIIKKTN